MSARDFSRRSNRRRTNRRFLPKFLGAFGDNHLFGGIGGGIGGDGFGDGLDEDSWGAVVNFISDLDSERTVRQIQCLLERLTKPNLFLAASEKQMELATKDANSKDAA